MNFATVWMGNNSYFCDAVADVPSQKALAKHDEVDAICRVV